ncbi:MAG: terminase [Alphaproteobacteria bacterium]|nr:terminase [Alphaproteobacteria bacterium]
MATIDLKYNPREWQRRCHLDRKRFTVLALHRRAGKTELAIMELIQAALTFKNDLGLFFYVAPFLKQAKIIAWARLKQRLRPLLIAGAVEINESELAVTFRHNGAVIRIYGGDNPDGMRGVRLDGAVIDEVAQIKPEVWVDIIQPALSDRKGWALFIGTPSGVNLFSELFYKGQQYKDWHSALWTVHDTDALDPEEVERLKRDMSETSFAREYLCDFSAAGDDQLISMADIEIACQHVYKSADIKYAPRILGVDPARFGNDRSVIFPRQGLQSFQPIIYHGIDNMLLAAKVAAKIESWKPDAVFIDAGAGAGVIDRLRQLGHDVIEVNFGGKPTEAQYANKRTEMWFGVREWLRAGGALINITQLKQDLGAPVYWYDAANRLMLEPKDDIKKRGLPSPDLGDALALTFASPVEKREKPIVIVDGMRNHEERAYDPISNI